MNTHTPLRRLRAFAGLALAALALSASTTVATATEIVLTDPDYGKVNASALDQPRLYAIPTDPTNGNAIFTWDNPNGDPDEIVLIEAFIDTGASGVALSRLHADNTNEADLPNLGFDASDYLGIFTETGIGGTEVGDVSRPIGIRVRSGGLPESGEMLPSDFEAYGNFNLWVRRTIGDSEYFGPINLIGMPVIRQRRLHLDLRPLESFGESMETHLLASTAAEPSTQATIPLVLHDFIGNTPPPGEVLPSHSANPLVPGITLQEGTNTVSATWLLDTGAGSSFTTFANAKTLGLIPAQYNSLSEFMATYDGPTAEIGGIGATQVVPILNLDRLSIPSREGALLVWKNVDLLVVDVSGLQGIFGMNLLEPSITLDPDDFGSLFDISPPMFSAAVIDATNAADPVLRLSTPRANGTAYAWLGATFSAAERSNPAIGTFTADADRDGLANLIEYALGLDARVANPGAAPTAAKVAATGGEFLALSFSRPIGGVSGVTYAVEVSNDLQTWRRSSADVVLHQTVTNGARETLTYRATTVLTANSRVFLRLAVATAP